MICFRNDVQLQLCFVLFKVTRFRTIASGVLFFVFSGAVSSSKVFISSSVYVTIDPGTSSVVASPFCLVELCMPFSGPCSQAFLVFSFSRAKEVFYAFSRICTSVQNKEEPPAHFKNAFVCF